MDDHCCSFQELEEDKVREENKKKKQAAKRRDKRKKKKKQKETGLQTLNVEPLPSENRACNANDMNEEDNTCSEEETSNSDVNNEERTRRLEEDRREVKCLKHVSQYRAKTVGQALDDKGDTNSTEERRDDQPQAVFDASDNQETVSPKKREKTFKATQDAENNKRNSNNSGLNNKSSPRHRLQDDDSERVVQSSTFTKDSEQFASQQMENVMVKVKGSDITGGVASELAPKANAVKNSGTSISNPDAYLKENGRVNGKKCFRISEARSFACCNTHSHFPHSDSTFEHF